MFFLPLIQTGAMSATGAVFGMMAAGVTFAPAALIGIAAGTGAIALSVHAKNKKKQELKK